MGSILAVIKDREAKGLITDLGKKDGTMIKTVTTTASLDKNLKPDLDLVIVELSCARKGWEDFRRSLSPIEGQVPVMVIGRPPEEPGMALIRSIDKPVDEKEFQNLYQQLMELGRISREKHALLEQIEGLCKELPSNKERGGQNEDYHTMVEKTSEGVVVIQNGRIRYANNRFCGIIGSDREDVLNGKTEKFFPPEIEQEIITVARSEKNPVPPKQFESAIQEIDGKLIPVEVNIQETTFDKKPSVLVFISDITESKKLQSQIIQTSNLAAIGQIAIGLAHDINTPLANISLLTENVSSHTDDEFIQKKLDTISRQVDVITNIIKNLLSFYRRARDMYSDVNINEVVLDTLNISKDLMRNQLDIELVFEEDLPLIMGNPEQLSQVFLNMMINADDSISKDGQLIIKTYFDDEFVYVEFKDNGCGIPEDKIYSIFDPFYTTKQPNKGIGLGLSICHGIVQSHNGKIDVTSKVGKGTTFTILLRR